MNHQGAYSFSARAISWIKHCTIEAFKQDDRAGLLIHRPLFIGYHTHGVQLRQVLIQIWQFMWYIQCMHLNNVASPQVQFLAVIEQCLRELATVSVSAGQGHVDKGQLLGLQTLRFSQT